MAPLVVSGEAGSEARFRVVVDDAVCSGHGRCYELAPEVFDEDASGYCVLRHETIGKTLLAQARSGEANCPERAIRVEPL